MGDNATTIADADAADPCQGNLTAEGSILGNLTGSCGGNASVGGDAQPKCKEQEYYSFDYAVVGTLFQSIIFVVGVLGNVLVCTVVRRTRSMHSTTNCYLVRCMYIRRLP